MQHQREKPEFSFTKHNYRAAVVLWQVAGFAGETPRACSKRGLTLSGEAIGQ
jgi:hypothetical protein